MARIAPGHFPAGDFAPFIEPRTSGECECIACGTLWFASWPLGCKALACPVCESEDTVREADCLPDEPAPACPPDSPF